MSDERFTRKQVAEMFGITEEELADDNGWAAARAEADRHLEAFKTKLTACAEAFAAHLTEGESADSGAAGGGTGEQWVPDRFYGDGPDLRAKEK